MAQREEREEQQTQRKRSSLFKSTSFTRTTVGKEDDMVPAPPTRAPPSTLTRPPLMLRTLPHRIQAVHQWPPFTLCLPDTVHHQHSHISKSHTVCAAAVESSKSVFELMIVSQSPSTNSPTPFIHTPHLIWFATCVWLQEDPTRLRTDSVEEPRQSRMVQYCTIPLIHATRNASSPAVHTATSSCSIFLC